MLDPAQSQAILARIRGMGITVSVDDFGSGYTSIGHLRRLPVDELKLDRSLVAKMSSDTGDATIVRAVIDLAHDLGLRTVAEGIEDETTLERLSLLGCDSVQGYHIGRPMPAAELQAWVDVFEAVARTRSVGGAPLLTRAAMDPR